MRPSKTDVKYDWYLSAGDAVYYGAKRFQETRWRWGKLYAVPMGDNMDGVPGTLDLALMFSTLRNLAEEGKPVSSGHLAVKFKEGQFYFGVERVKIAKRGHLLAGGTR